MPDTFVRSHGPHAQSNPLLPHPQSLHLPPQTSTTYILEHLVDAQNYAMHASRTLAALLIPADLLLAAEMRGDAKGPETTERNYGFSLQSES